MKRSRRVVLTLMGRAAIGIVSIAPAMAVARPRSCGPGNEAIPGPGGRPYCRPIHGGFGGTVHRVHGHGHAGG